MLSDTSVMALYIHGDHAFSFDDTKMKELMTKMTKTRPQLRPEVVVAAKSQSKTAPPAEWTPYQHGTPAGHYTQAISWAGASTYIKRASCP